MGIITSDSDATTTVNAGAKRRFGRQGRVGGGQDYAESDPDVEAGHDRFLVVVASVPPPVAGQSLATAQLLEYLNGAAVRHRVVDIGEHVTAPSLRQSLARVGFVASLPFRLLVASRSAEDAPVTMYIQLAGSRTGILRDLPLLWLAHRRGWRIVGHFHSRSWSTAIDRLPAPVRRAALVATRWCERIVVLTPGGASMFPWPDDEGPDVHVVHNRVDAGLERAAAETPPRPRSGDSATVLFLGNLIPGKGLPMLAQIAREAERRGLDHRFVVAGAGDRTLLGESPPPSIEVRGFLDGPQKIAALREADVLLLPSTLDEGEPLSVIEAYWFGLPVVASAVGGLVDLVGEPNGRLVHQDDRDGFLSAISEVLDAPTWNAMSAANRERARHHHDGSQHRERLIELVIR